MYIELANGERVSDTLYTLPNEPLIVRCKASNYRRQKNGQR